jgi:hypothetical protein
VVDAIKAVTDLLPDAGALTSIATSAALATVDGNVDAIKATTDKLDDTLEDSGAGAYIFTEASLTNAPASGGGGDATEAKQDTIIAALAVVDSNVDAILVDTAEIGAAGAGLTALASQASVDTIDANVDSILTDTGTTLDGKLDTIDTVVDAIKAKTDSLTFTQAGHVDANIQRINDVAITGNGQAGTEFSV